MTGADSIHLPEAWEAAIGRLEAHRRIAVLGPTDSGKSSFAAALLERRPDLALLDLDPGQKMLGAPGTVSMGRMEAACLKLERFVFIGSTSSSDIYHLTRGAATLAGPAGGFVANTSGFVRGLGARLQVATLAALGADAVVALGPEAETAPILEARPDLVSIRLPASPMARRKSAAVRAALRQRAFAAALAGAEEIVLPPGEMIFEPGPPLAVELGAKHPVCALAAEEDLAIGLLLACDGEKVRLLARRPSRQPQRIRLGRMWARPGESGWNLIDALSPAWLHEEPEG